MIPLGAREDARDSSEIFPVACQLLEALGAQP